MSSPVVSSLKRLARGRAVRVALAAGVLACLAGPALASGDGAMPWEGKLTAVANSITGPTARAVGVIAIAVAGLATALSEGGTWMRRGLAIVFGLTIAFTASSFGMSFFGATAGAAF